MSDDSKFVYQGEVFGLGLQMPDRIPLSFAEVPAGSAMELDQLKHLYANNNRSHALEIYKRRKNQGRVSSCCPYAATTAMEVKRCFDYKQDVEFGPEHLYAKINGGRDAGAMLDAAMKELVARGCALRASVPYQVHTMNSLTMEQKRHADQEAFDYRSLDWHKMPHGNPDQCWAATLTAIATRDPVLMAVHCGNNFFSCGPDGVCRVDRGPGNHAVCGVELEGVATARSIRDIRIWTINSHGARAGKNGCYLHTYDHMVEPCKYHQHCACRSVRTSPEEVVSTSLVS